jgi:predicted PurR-regulated permease PerM
MNRPAQVSRVSVVLLTVVVVVAVLRYAQDVFIPLALALLMTFLLAPLVDRLQRWGINRAVAVLVTVALAFGLIGGLAYIVFNQFTDLAHELPHYRRQLRHNLSDLTGWVKLGMVDTTSAMRELNEEFAKAAPAGVTSHVSKVQVVTPPPTAIGGLLALFKPLIRPIGTAALVCVLVIFMLLRFADVRDRFIRLLGQRNLRVTTEALDDAAKRVSRYLVMQTLINSWQGLCVAIGLTLIGLPNAMLWGALTVALRFIPYIGPWVAAAMPVALSFAVFDNWTHPLLTVGLFVFVELISNMALEPWLYGNRTGVSPLALLIAAAFWAWLWGAAGLFLAIPLTVCLVVMGKYIPQLEFLHVLLGDQPVLEPHERLYQRLLASNREEADDLLESSLRQQSLAEVCDVVVIPALQLAEEDHDRGSLREAKRKYVLDHVEQWADELIESGGKFHGNVVKPIPANIPHVLCMPGADRADEIAAKLLAAVIIGQGVPARAVSRLETRVLDGSAEPGVVIISAVPPDAVIYARHACKRARTSYPDTPIVVGLWHAKGDLQRSRQRLDPVGASRIVTSFSACVTQIESGALTRRETAPALVPPAGSQTHSAARGPTVQSEAS